MKNSFDLLRLIAATAVLFSHQYTFLGDTEPMVFGVRNLGHSAVIIFFILSGWLIQKSWSRDPHALSFLKKRCTRIFPALVVSTLLTVFILGPIVTALPLNEYFSNSQTYKYLLNSFLIPIYKLPGVFEQNRYPEIVNGSLWTLPAEFSLYLTVLGLGLAGILARKKFLYATVFIMAIAASVCGVYFQGNLELVTELLLVFWMGALLGIQTNEALITTAASLALYALIGFFAGPPSLMRGLLILVAIILVYGSSKTAIGSKITEHTGDWSYGVYIYAFPVQQTLAYFFGSKNYPYLFYSVTSLFITYILAGLSWNYVEKGFLERAKRSTQ